MYILTVNNQYILRVSLFALFPDGAVSDDIFAPTEMPRSPPEAPRGPPEQPRSVPETVKTLNGTPAYGLPI